MMMLVMEADDVAVETHRVFADTNEQACLGGGAGTVGLR